MALTELPAELLHAIVAHLGTWDAARLALTCRAVAGPVQDALWRRFFKSWKQNHRAALVLGPPPAYLFRLARGDVRPSLNDCQLSALLIFAEHNHLVGARWLARKYHLRFDKSTETIVARALLVACANGHPVMVQWLMDAFQPSRTLVLKSGAWNACCAGGHLALAKMLFERLGGCRAVAQWWRLGLFSNGELSLACESFVDACKHGHLRVAQWLHAHLKITDEQVRGSQAFRQSYKPNSFHVAVWIAERFGLSVPDHNFCQDWGKRFNDQQVQTPNLNNYLIYK